MLRKRLHLDTQTVIVSICIGGQNSSDKQETDSIQQRFDNLDYIVEVNTV